MHDILFLQSASADPYTFYRTMRTHTPLYHDTGRNLWGVYTYQHCREVLLHSAAVIPDSTAFFDGLGAEACRIGKDLARLSNEPRHEASRNAAKQVFARWRPVPVSPLMQYLLGEPRLPAGFDWVQQVALRLPAFTLLRGMGFAIDVIETITQALPDLVRIMLPVKSPDDALAINTAARTIEPLLRTYIESTMQVDNADTMNRYVSNLAGLLIQSLDACRGLLSHSLLQALSHTERYTETHDVNRFVREVLRMEPPVHNTRRILTEDIRLGDRLVPKGAAVLVVLASANRDEKQFEAAEQFNPATPRQVPYLSYGTGAHHCIAEYFSISITAAALQYMFQHYKHIELLEPVVQYEPKVNVRLPMRMPIQVY